MLGLSWAMAMTVNSNLEAVEITVYNQGFALVKEVRTLDLAAGRQQVLIENVAERIEPTSVGIRVAEGERLFTVLEQNYQYDLISPAAILNKAVGKTIVFNRVLPDGRQERIEGILLSSPTAVVAGLGQQQQRTWNGMVLRTKDGRILLDPTGEVEVAEIPEGLISRPTLVWDLQASRAGRQRIELSYITQGLTWNADYVLSLDRAGRLGDLQGWVSIDNQAGATWSDAKLKLLAGDVARVQEMMDQRLRGVGGAMPMAEKAFEQEAFADYHLYTLQRPATLRQREIKQIALLEASRVPVTKSLVVDFGRGMSMPQEADPDTVTTRPAIVIELKNDEASNLGMPLPMGNFKVYQEDSAGSLQLVGESRIGHTPRDEVIRLTVGRAFDVVAERKRLAFSWITDDRGPGGAKRNVGARETIEIEVRNRKDVPETVRVRETQWGEWRIIEETLPHTRLSASVIEFVVELKARETKKFKYTVESRWAG